MNDELEKLASVATELKRGDVNQQVRPNVEIIRLGYRCVMIRELYKAGNIISATHGSTR